MRPPFYVFAFSLLLLALLPAIPAAGQTPSAAPSVPVTDEEIVGRIQLPDAPLESVLQLVELWTGRTVLRAQNVQSPNYNLITSGPLPKSQALLALETLMNMNGVGMAPLGERFIKVVPLANVRIEAPEFLEGTTFDRPASGRVVTKLFTLQFLRVAEFLPQVASLLNPQLGGPVLFDKANAALITDSLSTLQRVESLIAQLDRPITTGLTPKFYTLQFSKASDLVNKLRTILQGPVQQQLGTATTYNADDRTNQLILIADPRLHPFFDDLVAKMDVKADPNTRNEVIPLNNADATEVATLLSQLVSGQTQALARSASVRPTQITPAGPGATPPPPPAAQATMQAATELGVGSNEFSSLVTILPETRTNSVVVSGTVDDIRLLTELVKKIDILLAQVRLEVIVAEVTLSENHSTGISQLGLVVSGDKLVGFAGGGPGFNIANSQITRGADVISGLRDFAGSLNLTSNSSDHGRSNVAILSQPTIVTTHNKPASIFVGQSLPIITGTQRTPVGTTGPSVDSGFSSSSTVSYRDIGIRLEVTPLIGGDGSVQLEIAQTVEDVIDSVTIDGNEQPVIGQRETESFISVRNGEIIVLGGIQRTRQDRSRSRLGPIPIIGDLLGTRRRGETRTDLVFFLRPTILDNSAADNEAALRQIDALPNSDKIRRVILPDEFDTGESTPPARPLTRSGPRN